MSSEELKIVWSLRRVLHALEATQAIELLQSKLRDTKSNRDRVTVLPEAFSKAHRAVWSTGVAVTFGYTFAQPRATYSTHPMPVPGGYAFAHSDNSRAAVLSRSASSLCPPSGKTFPFLYVPLAGEPLFHFPTRLVDWMFALYPLLPSLSIG